MPSLPTFGFSNLTDGGESVDELLVNRLKRLQSLGDPVCVTKVGPEGACVILLRTDNIQAMVEFEVDERTEAAELDWYDAWQVVGCFVSYTLERGETQRAAELISASRDGLLNVLDVRERQLGMSLRA